jgi:uncharacterized membrane protein
MSQVYLDFFNSWTSIPIFRLAIEMKSDGLVLAAMIMAGMLAALIFTFWIGGRVFQEKPLPNFPGWIVSTIPILALAGLGVALYLTIIETTAVPAVCGPIGDCNAVQQSSYSRVFGLIPVGVLGILGYLVILVAWAWGRFRSGALAGLAAPGIFACSFFGTLFSVYLTYLELFVIKAVCIWCLSSAVIITLLMLASLPQAAKWMTGLEENE